MQVEISALSGRSLRSSHCWQVRGEAEVDFQLTGQSKGRLINKNKLPEAEGHQRYLFIDCSTYLYILGWMLCYYPPSWQSFQHSCRILIEELDYCYYPDSLYMMYSLRNSQLHNLKINGTSNVRQDKGSLNRLDAVKGRERGTSTLYRSSITVTMWRCHFTYHYSQEHQRLQSFH